MEWHGRNSFGPNLKVVTGPNGPYYTEPSACLFQRPNPNAKMRLFFSGHLVDSSEYISRPDFSNESEVNIAVAGFGDDSGFGRQKHDETYIPFPVENENYTTWYTDSRVTHHICNDDVMLNDSTSYTGNAPLLMSDGIRARIASMCNFKLDTFTRVLHLTNVLYVPSIRKNLLSVSQFAKDNNVYFEFHLFHYLIKDI